MYKKLALKDRLLTLITGVPPMPEMTEKELEEKPKGITIRFSPKVRRWLDHQSEHLGCSIQELVSITMTSTMQATETPVASEQEITCARFRQIFETYGIGHFDIPDFFESDKLTRSQLMNDEVLINTLTQSMLDEVGAKLNINPAWITCESDEVLPNKRYFSWYKNVGGVAYRLARHVLNYEKVEVLFVVGHEGYDVIEAMATAAKDNFASNYGLYVGVVLRRYVNVAGKQVAVYDVLESGQWTYAKSRSHLKLLMMFCSRTGIQYQGIKLAQKRFSKLFHGGALPADVLTKIRDIWFPDQLLWKRDERNLEAAELRWIETMYEQGDSEAGTKNILIHENAIKRPSELVDIEAYKSGDWSKEALLQHST